MAGISNHTIVDFIEKRTNDVVKKNFIGIFPSNYVTRFITFHSMMTENEARYPFIIMNTDRSDKKGHIGGVFLIYIQKNNFFYLTGLGLKASKNLFYKMIEKTLNKILYGIKRVEKKKKR